MSKVRDLTDYLNDIITAITDIEEFTQGMSYEVFSEDKKKLKPLIDALTSAKRIDLNNR
jgi:uncharacterized protein with HEPN domain